jgi:acyl carrier protein
VRNAVAEDDPAIFDSTFAAARVRDVNGFIVPKTALAQDGDRANAGIIAENPPRPSRRILGVTECEKKDCADGDPRHVERQKHLRPATRDLRPDSHIIPAAMNRGEIEQKLIDIVRQEKPGLPADQLTPETALAEAGIDSLDALTILFAIEETFKISIPDDRARAMKTFGDMVDVVVALIPAS